MNIVFAGSPVFASVALQALCRAGHHVSLVLTQPDRPAGRGLKCKPGAVKLATLAAGIPVAQPRSLRLDGQYPQEAAAAQQVLQQAAPDLMVVAAYGLILPPWVLTLPTYGALNIHASLLPRWRGAAPIQRAIQAGDTETGITIMQMDQGLDTGDIVLMRPLPLLPEYNAAQLHDALAQLGAQAILEAVDALQAGSLRAYPQPEAGVTYAAKLQTSEALLDTRQAAVVLARTVRAFNPVPGAMLALPGLTQPVKIWSAHAMAQNTAGVQPGAVADTGAAGIDVVTGDGVLRITELQKAGGKRQPAATFIQGWRPA